MDHGEMIVFSGNANRPLAEAVAAALHVELGDADVSRFSDGEVHVEINESVRGADCFIIQPTCPPADAHLMELLVMIDALRRGSAGRIVAVLPYYGYARQDRKVRGREPITAKLVANLITAAGADRVLAMDLHADQIQGFFDLPVDHLPARRIIADYLISEGYCGESTVIVSPDVGGVNDARIVADECDAGLVIIAKRRRVANQVEAIEVIGEVEGKRAILIDDMVDTAGTICLGAELLMARGAAEVCCAATHAVLSGPAIQRLRDSAFTRAIFTDTIPLTAHNRLEKMTILTVADLFADAIDRIHCDESVSLCLARRPARQRRMF